MTTTQYEIRPIPPLVLQRLRGVDDAGNPPRLLTEDAEGGSPLRCCLSRSKPHEAIALVSYAPLRRWAAATGAEPGPYDEVGPVFIHQHDCGGFRGDTVPAEMRGERRVLRAYDAAGNNLGGIFVAGDTGVGRGSGASGEPTGAGPTIESALRELYQKPDVAVVHLRAVEYGCFLLETRRASDG